MGQKNPKFAKARASGLLCIAVAVTAGMPLTACRDTNPYTSRRDTIRLGAGDAMAHNRAVHTIDPWPVHSKDTRIDMDGKRAMVGVERYQRNESIEPQGTDTTGGRFGEDEGAAGAPPPAAPAP